jgi:tetratricopeptide (TPR) repeat protein
VSEQLFKQAEQSYKAGDLNRARSLCNDLQQTVDQPPISVIELLCKIEHQAGRFDIALKHADVLVKAKPRHVEHGSNRAALLGLLGRFSEAVDECLRVLTFSPDHKDTNLNLGSAYLRLSRTWSAKQHLEVVVEKFPEFPEASFMLTKALIALGDYKKALLEIERGHRLAPGDCEIAMMFADVKANTGDVEGAIRLYRQLLNLHPDQAAHILLSLGNAYGYRGDSERAVAALQECMLLDPKAYSAARSLTLHEKMAPDSTFAHQLLVWFRDGTLSHQQKSHIAFALASIQDRAKSFDKASYYFREGNRSLRASLQADGTTLEIPVYRRAFDMTRSTLAEIAKAGLSKGSGVSDSGSIQPVFIVGMPRSGSTMTEQIIGGHSKVTSAGEVNYFSVSFTAFLEEGPQLVPKRDDWLDLSKSLGQFAERYMQQISSHIEGAELVTDKWLYNFLKVGLICEVFPQAKIVWCVRDPRDCSVSIYNTHFAKGHLYTTDFDEIAACYALHEEVLKYWQKTCPGQFYVQSYEAMVNSPETEVPALLNYCGLPMQEACLNFHQRDNSVLTASMAQVRQPIHSGSVARWRHYESYQPELDNALKRHGVLAG